MEIFFAYVLNVILGIVLLFVITALLYNFYCFFVDVSKSPLQNRKEGNCSCGSWKIEHYLMKKQSEDEEDSITYATRCSRCGDSLDIYDLKEEWVNKSGLEICSSLRGKR